MRRLFGRFFLLHLFFMHRHRFFFRRRLVLCRRQLFARLRRRFGCGSFFLLPYSTLHLVRLAHMERKVSFGGQQFAQTLCTLGFDALLFGRLLFFYELTLGTAHLLQCRAHIGMRLFNSLKELFRLLLQLLCRINEFCFRHSCHPRANLRSCPMHMHRVSFARTVHL